MGSTKTEYPYISPNGIVHSETSRSAEHVNAMEHDEVTPPRDDDDREFARDDDSLPTTEVSAVPPPSSPPVPVLRAITDDHVRDRKGLLPIQNKGNRFSNVVSLVCVVTCDRCACVTADHLPKTKRESVVTKEGRVDTSAVIMHEN